MSSSILLTGGAGFIGLNHVAHLAALGSVPRSVADPLTSNAVNEHYAEVFSRVYGFHTIGLRYFNVFGPRQNPDNPYAAVIPIFCKAFTEGQPPTIFGDGHTSRDFTYVDNAVQAIVLMQFRPAPEHAGDVKYSLTIIVKQNHLI